MEIVGTPAGCSAVMGHALLPAAAAAAESLCDAAMPAASSIIACFSHAGCRPLQYKAYADRTMSRRLKGLTRKWSSSDIAEGLCHHSCMLP